MPKIAVTTRREWLTRGLGLVGIGGAVPRFLVRSALGGPTAEPDQRVLVVLQLDGGNDALSTLVPYGNPRYYEYRKEATRIPESEVIRVNEALGFHPHLGGWKRLLDKGWLAAVQGIGYPNPNYSHFTATDTWLMGDPRGRQVPFGWVGRACDAGFPDSSDAKRAVAVGNSFGAGLALRGERHSGILINDPSTFGYGSADNDRQLATYGRLNDSGVATRAGELEWITSTAITANAASEEIRRVAMAYRPKVNYPDTAYGRHLRTIAGLIAGGLSSRIYWTGRDGRFEFDTHANQKPKHDGLLKELNDALTAFWDDLDGHGQANRVLLFTISEFGRTSKENGNKGTDHAAASTQFLFGPGVKPGIHGTHPSLEPEDLLPIGSSFPHSVDFRSLYATVLDKWLGISGERALGQAWPLLDCVA